MANPSISTVIGLGLGMVFVGLIFIIFLCYLLGIVVQKFTKKEVSQEINKNSINKTIDIKDKKEFVAVIATCIAETMNKDIEAIRIKSIKRV